MSQAIYDIPLQTLQGKPATLGDYQGKVILVVNVASKCGLTPQYEGLEKLYTDKKGDGLVVAGFPANNFKEQEPGSDAEIADFCTTNYGVDFPMFSKISVKGSDQHPLYKALTDAQPTTEGDGPMRDKLVSFGIDTGAANDVLWNFEKFLIGKDGKVVGRFAPDIAADDPRLTKAVEAALNA